MPLPVCTSAPAIVWLRAQSTKRSSKVGGRRSPSAEIDPSPYRVIGETARMGFTGDVLVAHELRKTFKNVHAVCGVSITVAPGERVGLLGPNGAGKTTTLL